MKYFADVLSADVLAVASGGGHLVQMSRLLEAFSNKTVTVISTFEKKPSFIGGEQYICIDDVSRDKKLKVFILFFKSFLLIRKINPAVAVSTGAAPGLIFLFCSFMQGRQTIWLDSIANSERVSLSCRLASCFCTNVLTQWPHLESSRVRYLGRII